MNRVATGWASKVGQDQPTLLRIPQFFWEMFVSCFLAEKLFVSDGRVSITPGFVMIPVPVKRA